uniref:Ovule protein n=1 Tax=Heterorhabditis bacteriophora TaxID=37862 RepID=A0A1I7X013_HETBA
MCRLALMYVLVDALSALAIICFDIVRTAKNRLLKILGTASFSLELLFLFLILIIASSCMELGNSSRIVTFSNLSIRSDCLRSSRSAREEAHRAVKFYEVHANVLMFA